MEERKASEFDIAVVQFLSKQLEHTRACATAKDTDSETRKLREAELKALDGMFEMVVRSTFEPRFIVHDDQDRVSYFV